MEYQDFQYVPYVLTPKDVYNKSVLDQGVPQHFRAVDFRVPRVGETFLNCSGNAEILIGVAAPRPRLILEKNRRRRVTFEATGEYRAVCKGEFYFSIDGPHVYLWTCNQKTSAPYNICRLVEDIEE